MAVRKRELRPATRQGYINALKVRDTDHLSTLRELPLEHLARRHLIDLRDSGCPIELLRKLGVVFSWAEERDLIDHAPRLRLPSSRRDTRSLVQAVGDAPIDMSELRAVWAATAGLPQVWRALYRVQILTGTRPQEIERLRWDDVRLSGKATAKIDGKTGPRAGGAADRGGRQRACAARARERSAAEGIAVGVRGADFAIAPPVQAGRYSRQGYPRVARHQVAEKASAQVGQNVDGAGVRRRAGALSMGHATGTDARYDQSDRVARLREAFNRFHEAITADE